VNVQKLIDESPWAFTDYQIEWLVALPEYAKTTGTLYRPNEGFCCLGVEAEIHDPNEWEITDIGTGFYMSGDRSVNNIALSEERWRALGLASEIGTFIGGPIWPDKSKSFPSLAALNDWSGWETHEPMVEFIIEHANKVFVRIRRKE
jgi:hypothetical protein